PMRGPVVARRAATVELAGPEVALGELPGRPTLRRHEEDLRRSLFDVAGPITTVMQPVHDARRGGPLRAFRRGRHADLPRRLVLHQHRDRKSTRLNSSHEWISYAVFCLKKKTKNTT